MASKRKRRRAAARKEALRLVKREKAEVPAKPAVGTVYRDYTVAVQKKSTDPVHVITVREHDQAALHAFIARMQEVSSVNDLAFLEIHLQLPNGSVALVHEGGEWPKGATVIHNKGFVVRGKDRTLSVKEKPADKKPATVAPIKTVATAVVAQHPTPDGMYRIKFKRYSTKAINI